MCELQALPLISHQCATENMGMQVPLPTGPVPGQLSTWLTKPVGSLKLVANQSTSTCKGGRYGGARVGSQTGQSRPPPSEGPGGLSGTEATVRRP